MLVLFSSCVDDLISNPLDDRSKFVGSWQVSENSKTYGQSAFVMDIEKDDYLKIINLL